MGRVRGGEKDGEPAVFCPACARHEGMVDMNTEAANQIVGKGDMGEGW